MRLINADEIIKWVDDSVSQYGNTYSTDMLNMFGLFKHIIDNAPTVEAKTTADCIIAYGDGYETARRLSARPQGEWKYIPEGFTHTNGWECSNCKMRYHTKVPYFGEFNFCPKCGAEMKGVKE